MIELDKLSKTFTQKNGKEFRAVDSVSLTVGKARSASSSAPPAAARPPP